MTARPSDDSTAIRVVTVPSASDPAKAYTVVVHRDGSRTCSCLAGRYRRPCRHLVLATPAKLRPVRHSFGCGERIPCPAHGRLGPYNPAERLRNGDVIAHDCGRTWRPHELSQAAS